MSPKENVADPLACPEGALPSTGPSSGSGAVSWDVRWFWTFIDANLGVVTSAGCRAAAAQGHRAVGLPCGHQPTRRRGAQTPLLYGARGSTASRKRPQAPEAVVEADS